MAINIIEYITKNTDLKQKDIAEKLGVTTGQVSKWKKGEYISSDREKELNKLAGLFGDNADWAILVKTEENGKAWHDFLCEKDSRTEFPVLNYEIDEWFFAQWLLEVLDELGVPIPEIAPSMQDYNDFGELESGTFGEWESGVFTEYSEEACYRREEELNNKFFTEDGEDKGVIDWDLNELIGEICENWGAVVAWSYKYLIDAINDDEDVSEAKDELECMSIDISILSLPDGCLVSAGGDEKALFKYQSKAKKTAIEFINRYCQALTNSGTPITQDYFYLISKHAAWLGDETWMQDSLHNDEIERHLPYGERTILKELSYIRKVQEELHQKVDTLLSEKDKQMLDKKLEFTRPSHLKKKGDKGE